jgi:uncharacterized glyoxalase superfamily protein PhnB
MTKFQSLTPNLIVQNIDRSTAFYRDVLGFAVKETVPDAAPFVFVWLERDGLNVFLNDAAAVAAEMPDVTDRKFGGTATLYFIVTGVHALHDSVTSKTTIVMPLKTQEYGMREFAVLDPDGHLLTFAERQ